MPSITQLKYVLALHRFGHFGRAAEACRVAQPTLSAQIQKAEEELGAKLFVRHAKPVTLTEQGTKLLPQAQAVVAAHERMLQIARGDQDTPVGELNLGVIPTLAPYVLPWFLRPFAHRYPQVRLHISERTTDDIIAALKRQTIDVGLLALSLDEARITERPLFEDPFYLYAAPEEPDLTSEELKAEDLNPERLWLLQEGHCVRAQTLSLCRTGDRSNPLGGVRFEAGSFETLQNIIDASGGYTIVPETFARQLPRDRRRAQIRAFDDPVPTRVVGLVHLNDTWKVDLVDRLEQTLMEHLPRPFQTPPESSRALPVRTERARPHPDA